jgi:hypothetical protein
MIIEWRNQVMNYFHIYAIEIQEEAPMDKKHHWKRGKEKFTANPTLIYMESCREFNGREIIREIYQ